VGVGALLARTGAGKTTSFYIKFVGLIAPDTGTGSSSMASDTRAFHVPAGAGSSASAYLPQEPSVFSQADGGGDLSCLCSKCSPLLPLKVAFAPDGKNCWIS